MKLKSIWFCILVISLCLQGVSSPASATGALIKAEKEPNGELKASDLSTRTHLNGDYEIHLVSGYETQTGNPQIKVQVDRPGKSVALILSSYERAYWFIEPTLGTTIAEVFVGGFKESKVFSAHSFPVFHSKLSYVTETENINFENMLAFVASTYGRDHFTSFLGAYALPGEVLVNKDDSGKPELSRNFPPVERSPATFAFLLPASNPGWQYGPQDGPPTQIWTPEGPKDRRLPEEHDKPGRPGSIKVTSPNSTAQTPDGQLEFKIGKNQLIVIDKKSNEAMAYDLAPNFPRFSRVSGIAYIPDLNIVALSGLSFYRFDVAKQEWRDYRELGWRSSVGSLAYDPYTKHLIGVSSVSGCRFTEFTTDGEPLANIDLGSRLPGLWRTFDKHNRPCISLSVVPFQQYVAFLAFPQINMPPVTNNGKFDTVYRIWVLDRTTGKGVLTYKAKRGAK